MRLIDADKADVERIDCFYGSECRIEDIREWLNEQSTVNPYEWISIKEKLPKKFKDVLCFYPQKDYGSKVVVDYMETEDGYFAYQFKYGEPTHWMPLPVPPTEKEN